MCVKIAKSSVELMMERFYNENNIMIKCTKMSDRKIPFRLPSVTEKQRLLE